MRLQTTVPFLILASSVLAACTDAQRLVENAETIRGDCTEERLRAGDDACVEAFNRGAEYLESAMEIFAGALHTLDRLAAARGGVHFDTSFASLPDLDSLLAREARAIHDPLDLSQHDDAGDNYRGEQYGYRGEQYGYRGERYGYRTPYDRGTSQDPDRTYDREPLRYAPDRSSGGVGYDRDGRLRPDQRVPPYDRAEPHGYRPEPYAYDRDPIDDYGGRGSAAGAQARSPARDVDNERDAAGGLTYGALTERRAAAYEELLRRRTGSVAPAPGGYMQPRRDEREYLHPQLESGYLPPRAAPDFRVPHMGSDFRRPYFDQEYRRPYFDDEYRAPYLDHEYRDRRDDDCYRLESELRRSLTGRAPADMRRIASLLAELEAWCLAPAANAPGRDDGSHSRRPVQRR
jgi:hypothetical protein